MSPFGLLAILVVVVAVALVRPVSVQATLYSLPIPLTVGLASVTGDVSPLQPLSVFGVIGFFFLASLLRDRFVNRFFASIIAGVAVFPAIVSLTAIPLADPWIASAIAVVAWIPVGIVATRYLRKRPDDPQPRQVSWTNIVTALPMFAIAALVAPLAGSLTAMYPFAGLAVSTAVQGRLWRFAHSFSLRAIALIGFSSVYAIAKIDFAASTLVALLLSWATYVLVLGLTIGIDPIIRRGHEAAGR